MYITAVVISRVAVVVVGRTVLLHNILYTYAGRLNAGEKKGYIEKRVIIYKKKKKKPRTVEINVFGARKISVCLYDKKKINNIIVSCRLYNILF